MRAKSPAVLLLAYGSPETGEDVEPYFTHIRGGRTPSPEAVADLRARYRAVGGGTPLLRITRSAAALLRLELDKQGWNSGVYVGMKHWHPFIAESFEEIRADAVQRLIAIPLAPHYSRMSIGGYRAAVDSAASESGIETAFVDQWHDHPAFIQLIARRIRDVLSGLGDVKKDKTAVLFSAHSLPERIRTWDDPYEHQLAETCRLVAGQAGLEEWHFAWQSAGHTDEPWLGPDIIEYLGKLSAEGVKNVVSVPVGFVCDHLEVLYDIDIEARNRARELGMRLVRTEMPNASGDFVQLLAGIAGAAEKHFRVTGSA